MSQIPVFGERRPDVTYEDRPGAYALVRCDNRIAVVRTSYGLFLPGGGIDPGESPRAALARELREEINHELVSARELGSAEQFHWSQHYQKHFRKIGYFFAVDMRPRPDWAKDAEHELVWLNVAKAESSLAQSFQRFALSLT